MRQLSPGYMCDLKDGFLGPLLKAIAMDRDLLLEIREDYLNVYFKGHSLLKLSQDGSGYAVRLHGKFRVDAIRRLDRLTCEEDTKAFVRAMPDVKQQILALGSSGNEIEYEQLLIRANNCEPRLNTDYLIIDRQLVTADKKGRFDLLGMHWPIKRAKTASLALIEVKYGLNNDIQKLHQQLEQYHAAVCTHLDSVVDEAEALLHQKLQLGLLILPQGQANALSQVRIIRRPESVRFVIALVDYHPGSRLLSTTLAQIQQLPFAHQVETFHVGFGLWRANCSILGPPQ